MYSAAISAGGKGQQAQRALALLREMQARSLKPDKLTYTAVISASEKGGGLWEQALALMKEMRKVGLRPDVITYNTTISACGKGT